MWPSIQLPYIDDLPRAIRTGWLVLQVKKKIPCGVVILLKMDFADRGIFDLICSACHLTRNSPRHLLHSNDSSEDLPLTQSKGADVKREATCNGTSLVFKRLFTTGSFWS